MLEGLRERIQAHKLARAVSDAAKGIKARQLNATRAQAVRLELVAAETLVTALESPEAKDSDKVLAAVGLLVYRLWLHWAHWHAPDGEDVLDLV